MVIDKKPLTVSVIIPTYNRKEWLVQTLDSLANQTLPKEQFEVIVVDDGSEDGTVDVLSQSFLTSVRYFRQENSGDAAARNTGVEHSQADILVFLDDDVVVEPEYLRFLLREHALDTSRIIVGTERLWLNDSNPLGVEQSNLPASGEDLVAIPFAKVCSNNMSIGRNQYYDVGMMQGLEFGGSSLWCDVDFAYRAHQLGFEFYRSTRAICWHRDYVARSLDNQKKRMREVAYRAAALFEKHPGLLPYLPMFDDKTPMAIGDDSLALIVRKLMWGVVSSRPALSVMEQCVGLMEDKDGAARIATPIERWIIGSHIYRGYREGLRDFATSSGLDDA